jgi:hypothetical protein
VFLPGRLCPGGRIRANNLDNLNRFHLPLPGPIRRKVGGELAPSLSTDDPFIPGGELAKTGGELAGIGLIPGGELADSTN